jgi:hypothetical protein
LGQLGTCDLRGRLRSGVVFVATLSMCGKSASVGLTYKRSRLERPVYINFIKRVPQFQGETGRSLSLNRVTSVREADAAMESAAKISSDVGAPTGEERLESVSGACSDPFAFFKERLDQKVAQPLFISIRAPLSFDDEEPVRLAACQGPQYFAGGG